LRYFQDFIETDFRRQQLPATPGSGWGSRCANIHRYAKPHARGAANRSPAPSKSGFQKAAILFVTKAFATTEDAAEFVEALRGHEYYWVNKRHFYAFSHALNCDANADVPRNS
jgi:hypothetical protein